MPITNLFRRLKLNPKQCLKGRPKSFHYIKRKKEGKRKTERERQTDRDTKGDTKRLASQTQRNPKQSPFFSINLCLTQRNKSLSAIMAADEQHPPEEIQQQQEEIVQEAKKVLCSYLGLSFCVFLALAPRNWREVQRHLRELSGRLWHAEEQLKQMRSRRKEDSKANARVVEIFASHRNAWQAEEKRLLHQIDAANQEVAHLNARIAEFEKAEADFGARIDHLKRELAERDEMIGFMSRNTGGSEFEDHSGDCRTEWYAGGGAKEECGLEPERELEDVNVVYEQYHQHHHHHHLDLPNGFDSEFASASKLWSERANLWQVGAFFIL